MFKVYNGTTRVGCSTKFRPTLPCRRNEQCFQRFHCAALP